MGDDISKGTFVYSTSISIMKIEKFDESCF